MKKWYEARQAELRERSDKGFTLMEMLIVVAIIAVLIAIAIPVFTSQLENSRESTDAANLRSAYALVAADGMTKNSGSSVISMQQRESGWSNTQLQNQSIGSYTIKDLSTTGAGWSLGWDSASQSVTITTQN